MNKFLLKILRYILGISRKKKTIILILTDISLVFLACYLAFSLRLGFFFVPRIHEIWLFLIAASFTPIIFSLLGLYRSVIRYIGYMASLNIIKATGLLVIMWIIAAHYVLPSYFEVEIAYFLDTLPIIFWLNLLLMIGGIRQIARWIFSFYDNNVRNKTNIIVYGAGKSGRTIINSLSDNNTLNIVGFIDDNSLLRGQYIGNYKVFGGMNRIPEIRQQFESLTVLIAIKNISSSKKRDIVNYLEDKSVNVRQLPSITDMALGKTNLSDFQNIDVLDLLGRESIKPNEELMTQCIEDKCVFVSGAGGSIGSELCRQIIKNNPKKLIILDKGEYNLYRVELDLINFIKANNLDIEVIAKLSSVNNYDALDNLFSENYVDTIYHSAAYKHVPLVEKNILEGLNNNVIGTYNIALAAYNHSVKNFVLVSTDKAVRPTNIMGASKRMAELVVQGFSSRIINEKKQRNTIFSIVRFGNVIGSSGSVIPLFDQQIKNKGPVTVTHPEVTRYFMTDKEAAQLVVQAGSMGNGGEVYVLDMGEPILIDKVAKRMIHLAGYQVANSEEEINTANSIFIEYTGLRDGEKLFEELLIGEDVSGTDHPKVMRANENFFEWEVIEAIILETRDAIMKNDQKKLMAIIKKTVTDYNYEKIN